MTRHALVFAALVGTVAPAFAQSGAPDSAGLETPESVALAPLAGTKIRCVNPAGTGGCFTTIQAAVNAASENDTISVSPGVYYENVRLTQPGLTLQGASKVNTIIDPSPNSAIPNGNASFGVVIVNANQKVKNLTIRNGKTDAIAVEAPNATIQGVLIEGPACNGVHVFPGNAGTQVLSSEFRSVGCAAVQADNPSTNTVVKLNALYGSDGDGIAITGDNAVVSSNKLYRCGSDCIDVRGATPVAQFNTILGSECEGVFLSGIDALATNNNVQNTECDALDVEGSNVVVKQNVVANVDDDGIFVNAVGSNISNNVITNAFDGEGIFAEGGGATVSNNKVTHAESTGVEVLGTNPVVTSNTTVGTDEGLFVQGTNPKVELNKVSNALFEGIEVECEPNCTASSVAKNSVTDTYGDEPAFFLLSDARGMVVANNTATRPQGTGFDIEGPFTVVQHNSVIDQGSSISDPCFLIGGGAQGGADEISFNTATRCSQNGFLVTNSGNTLTSNTVNTSYGNAFEIDAGATGTASQGFNTLTSNTAIGAAGAGFAVVSSDFNVLKGNVALVGNRTAFCDDGANTSADATNKFASVAPTCDIQR